jgi:hypothetical protein
MDSDQKPQRPWKEIASELAREHEVGRILQLSSELDDALETQINIYASPTQGHHC